MSLLVYTTDMKYFRQSLLIAYCLLLTGCFGLENLGNNDEEGIVFQIGENAWTLILPENWTETAPETLPDETVMIAQNLTQNFIIEQHLHYQEDLSQKILEHASTIFHYFEGLDLAENQWSFKAQSQANKPLRTYYQKVFPIPGTQNYLIGSCSHETIIEANDCETILSSWKLKKQK